MKKIIISSILIFGFFINAISVNADSGIQPQAKAAVATAHPLATQVGIDILKQGGNAFDAAAAVSVTLAVVEPYSSGIGGGGFWLLHKNADDLIHNENDKQASDQVNNLINKLGNKRINKQPKQIMIDGREMAPGKAHRDMYLDEQGEVIPGASLDGALAAGIPGAIAAVVHLSKNYGRLPLEKTLAPAIRLAEKGFAVTSRYQSMAGFRLQALQADPEAAKIFLHENQVPPLGHKIIQQDLATTLSAVANHGNAGFYKGETAKKLVAGVRASGGIWTEQDLANYKVIERAPVNGTYKKINISSASLPSSGGAVLIQALNILERKNLDQLQGTDRIHLITEAMRRAYQDRAEYMGDPDFVNFPDIIMEKPYAAIKASSITVDRATPSAELRSPSMPADSAQPKGTDTTHFSIVDAEGNRVAATLSVNYPFGACFVPPGTGVLLNDEMDDFSMRPKTPNAYGLIGDAANEIAPGKRPLSSMSPTFLETDDHIAILGTPGGSRIISMVLLGVLDFAEGNLPESWVAVPRFHHQYEPDLLQYELGAFSANEKQALEKMGHKLKEKSRYYGNMQAILIEKKTGKIHAASDPRGEGSAEVTEITSKGMNISGTR